MNPAHLFLGTLKDNTQDAVKKGRIYVFPPSFGESHGSSKLTEKQVVSIRKERLEGKTLSKLAEKYKVGIGCIQAIVTRKTWKHLSTSL